MRDILTGAVCEVTIGTISVSIDYDSRRSEFEASITLDDKSESELTARCLLHLVDHINELL